MKVRNNIDPHEYSYPEAERNLSGYLKEFIYCFPLWEYRPFDYPETNTLTQVPFGK